MPVGITDLFVFIFLKDFFFSTAVPAALDAFTPSFSAFSRRFIRTAVAFHSKKLDPGSRRVFTKGRRVVHSNYEVETLVSVFSHFFFCASIIPSANVTYHWRFIFFLRSGVEHAVSLESRVPIAVEIESDCDQIGG